MMADNNTYRGIVSDLQDMQTPWSNEPVPDHTTLVRHMQTIPKDWLDLIVSETARRCIDGAGGATGPLGADSSAAETTRYACREALWIDRGCPCNDLVDLGPMWPVKLMECFERRPKATVTQNHMPAS